MGGFKELSTTKKYLIVGWACLIVGVYAVITLPSIAGRIRHSHGYSI